MRLVLLKSWHTGCGDVSNHNEGKIYRFSLSSCAEEAKLSKSSEHQ